MRNRFARGVVSGFLATVVLSICMLIKSAVGIVPQANPIQALVKVSTLWLGSPLQPWVGWAEHFFTGAILWGVAFALVEPTLPRPTWVKGLIFSIGAWILMMVLLMPPAGAGWFAARLGYGAPLAALVLHLIWGFSIGAIYRALTPAGAGGAAREGPDLMSYEPHAPSPGEPSGLAPGESPSLAPDHSPLAPGDPAGPLPSSRRSRADRANERT